MAFHPTEEQHIRLLEISRALARSRSSLIRDALKMYLERFDRNTKNKTEIR